MQDTVEELYAEIVEALEGEGTFRTVHAQLTREGHNVGKRHNSLWAALNVEWLKGVAALKGIWADWGQATVDVFAGVSFKIAGLMVDAWAGSRPGTSTI